MSKTTQNAITTPTESNSNLKDLPATSHNSISSSMNWFKKLNKEKLIRRFCAFGMFCCFVFCIILLLAKFKVINAPILL